MVRDQAKTKQQLIVELERLRQRPVQPPESWDRCRLPPGLLPGRPGHGSGQPQWRSLQANRYLCEMLGDSDHELCAMGIGELTHPADLEATLRLLSNLPREPRVMQQECRFVHRYGHAFWVLVKSILVSDQKGRLRHVISLFMGIAQPKAVEKALHQSGGKYRTIFETAGSTIIIMEEDTIILLANSEFARLIGIRKKDLEGKRSWTEFIAPYDVERMLGYHRLRRVDPKAAPRAYDAQVKDGQEGLRDCLVTVAVVPGTRRSEALLLDLTERKQAEAERALLATAI
ncbi:hypothetical protein DFAR_1630011 [Desulfarculales bacterium]